jgi:hypothetical protein
MLVLLIGYITVLVFTAYSIFWGMTVCSDGISTTRHCVHNLFKNSDFFDLYFYTSHRPATGFNDLNHVVTWYNLSFEGLIQSETVEIELPSTVFMFSQNSKSEILAEPSEVEWHMHAILVQAGESPNRGESNSAHHLHVGAPLVRPASEASHSSTEVRRTLSLYLVRDRSSYVSGSMPLMGPGRQLKVAQVGSIE